MRLTLRIVAVILAAALSLSLFVSCEESGRNVKNDIKPVEGKNVITASNPLMWSDVPDEDVIRVGDTYYMVSTTMFFNPGVPIMKSKDLVTWEIIGYVYDVMENTAATELVGEENIYSHGSDRKSVV